MSIRCLSVLMVIAVVSGARAAMEVPFAIVKAGYVSYATKESQRVFRTPQEFATYWAAMFGTATKPKGIDWNRSELVAIHLGHRGSLGYDPRVLSVSRVGEHTLVTWSERLPTASKPPSHSCSPFVIVSFPVQTGKVLFRGLVQNPRKPYASGSAYPTRKFLTGSHCLLKSETTSVISDRPALAELWVAAFGQATPPPACDFTKWRLVAIFLGQRPTPGYAPIVDRIARIGPREVQVMYSESKPKPGSILPQLVTNPFVIIQIPVSGDEVSVERS
ncbi:MAG: protease complex subunit PrcB family protein [Fimbriimonadaceae bacterium]